MGGIRGAEQIAVFDEQQRIGEQSRHFVKIGEDARRNVGRVHDFALPVENPQPAGSFGMINGKAATPNKIIQRRRHPCLPRNLKPVALQCFDERRHVRIAESLIVGADFGKLQRRIRAGFQRIGHLRGIARQITRLQKGNLRFPIQGISRDQHQAKRDQPKPNPKWARYPHQQQQPVHDYFDTVPFIVTQ